MRKIFLFLFVLIVFDLSSQERLDVQTITIVDDFVPEVPDANKIDFTNNYSDSISVDKDFNYSLFDSHLIFPNEEVLISSVRLKGHPVDKIHNSFLKGGLFANNLNPSLNLYYNTLRLKNSDEFSWGIYGDYEKKKFNKLNIDDSYFALGTQFKKTWDKGVLTSFLDYQSNNYNCYSNENDFKKNNIFRLKGKYINLFNYKNGVNFDFNFDFHDTRIEKSYKESLFDLGFNIKHLMFKKDIYTSLNLSITSCLFDQDSFINQINNNLFSLSSFASSSFGLLDIQYGFRYFKNQDNHFYPYLNLLLNKDSEYNNFNFLISGSYVKNNIIDRLRENKYLIDYFIILNKNERINFSMNYSTKLSKSIMNKNNFSFSVLDNMHFFFLDTSSNRYSVLYDDVSNLKLKSEFIYNYDKDLDISASFIYNKFFMNFLSKPYFVPELKLDLGVSYVYDKQTSFIVDFSSGFRRWSNGQNEMNPFLTLDFVCNYEFNKYLNIDFIVDDISFGNYEYWLNYSSFPTSFLVKLSYVL